MSSELASYPYFQIYRLTFKSGCSYVGYHKMKSKYDNYVTSSSYYLKHPEDKLVNREVLVAVADEFQASFLETWCILSDKANNPELNVNYNLGNFFHRFSAGYHTLEEKKKSIEKGLITKSRRTEEQKAKTREKYRKTMAAKTPEELERIHYHQGKDEYGNTHKSKWWQSLTEEQKIAMKERMSKSTKEWMNSRSPDEIERFKKMCSTMRSQWWKNISEEDYENFQKMAKNRELRRWQKATESERKSRCRGLLESAEKRKRRVQCIETGKVFNSIQEVRSWLGSNVKDSNISSQIKGHYRFAYRNPETGEPLHWRYV